MAEIKEVVVPDIGDFKEIEIIEVLVKPGDEVKVEDSLITLESDKAAMEVPSPLTGVIQSLNVKAGDRVNQGSLILTMEVSGNAPAPGQQTEAVESVATAPPSEPVPQKAETPVSPAATPMVASTATVPSEREICVPDIGDFKDIEIIEVLVRPGDVIKADDSLITLESDKAAMEVPSPYAGTVKTVGVKAGDRVNQGSAILVLEVTENASLPSPPAAVDPQPVAATSSAPRASSPTPVPTAPPTSRAGRPQHASPAIRRFARELGVSLERVTGTGAKGRILREDVQQFVKQSLQQKDTRTATAGGFSLPAIPEVDYGKYGPVEKRALTRIQKLSGPNLHRNWVGIPHITQHDEADITDLEAFRQSLRKEAEKRDTRISLLPFVLKAVTASLKAFPSFNASLGSDGESLILKHYFHIGVAVDTPDGLVVPVIRDVDQKSLFDLASELVDLSQRARNKKLRGADLEGGCFTISSLGGIGGTAFTPIINAPEVAILGLSRSQMKPVWQGDQFEPRLMLPLSLSYDHRVIDGAQAARFIVHLSSVLADLRRVLL